MEIEIQNCPSEIYDKYEFIVCREYENQLWFWGAYSNGFFAYKVASSLENGVVIHINGKIEK